MRLEITTTRDKKKVMIRDDGYRLELLTMINGFKWTRQPIDEEVLEMIEETIDAYRKGKEL
jgi:hypothetical protein